MDVRKAFLDFFEHKGHKIYSSNPLVPDDATLLFTNAGMVQFKDIFTGKIPTPTNPKATSCQLCIRAGGKHNDLENVGFTARHHTLFEMLGNFSFGDYFKTDAIKYAWEFVTEILKLPKERLWVTVHHSDDEAFAIWENYISSERIKKFGDKDNFWQMGDTGACGPCSEIYYDQGEENFNSKEDYLGGDGDRFLEIWNLVFMQYERDLSGNLKPLPKPSIDTGMGLERVVAIREGVLSNYDSSLFMPLIREIERMAHKKYEYSSGASFRVIADHIRSTTFLLAQGVTFDREGRGYVLRRILRRAIRHGYLLGINAPFLYKLVDILVEQMGEQYIELKDKKESIKSSMELEESRFFATIASGIELFEKELQNTKDIFSGDVAFKLYDTYGFPLDLTEDMLKDKQLIVDKSRFEALMSEQKLRAKASWKGSGDKILDGDFKELLEKFGVNSFCGYETKECESEILALLDSEFREIHSLEADSEGYIMLNNSPFYAESGGQCGDSGELFLDGELIAKVIETKKFFNLNISKIESIKPILKDKKVVAKVSNERFEIAKHHSATHLLHKALREVLGESVAQAGSLVESKRLRFDFSYPKALSKDEIEKLESIVNEQIAKNIATTTTIMGVDEAKAKGAMALFGEKYGDVVRVVEMGDFSLELCGGTHISNSSEIGSFYILKESGVSAGVRRIEAVCGLSAIEYVKSIIKVYEEAKDELKSQDLLLGIKKLKETQKELKEQLTKSKSGAKVDLNETILNGVKVIIDEVIDIDAKVLIDNLKNQNEKLLIMLFVKLEDKLTIFAGVKGVSLSAKEWVLKVAKLLGGGGGGRDDFAQAGGKDLSLLNEAKELARDIIISSI